MVSNSIVSGCHEVTDSYVVLPYSCFDIKHVAHGFTIATAGRSDLPKGLPLRPVLAQSTKG